MEESYEEKLARCDSAIEEYSKTQKVIEARKALVRLALEYPESELLKMKEYEELREKGSTFIARGQMHILYSLGHWGHVYILWIKHDSSAFPVRSQAEHDSGK